MLLLHIGDHTGRTLRELAAHVFEPAHLLLAAVATVLVASMWRQRRRLVVRVRAMRGSRP